MSEQKPFCVTPWEDRESLYETPIFSQVERMEAEIAELRAAVSSQSPAPIPEQVAQASGLKGLTRYGTGRIGDLEKMADGEAYLVADVERLLATQSAKQGARPSMSQRQSFEHWFSDEGKSPRAVERSGDGYVLLSAQSAWEAWKAAYKVLDVTGRPSGSPSPVIQASVEQAPVAQEVTQQAAKAEAPTAWLATDLDGRGDVAFTKEEAKRRAGEGCTEFFPLYDFAPTTSTVSASGALAAAEDSSRADEDWFFHPNDD